MDNKPPFEEWKRHVLSVRFVRITPIDDFEMLQSVLSIRYWRIRLDFRFWDPFHLRFLLWTNKRLRSFYELAGDGYEYPSMIDITVGEWRNVRYE